MDSHINDLWLGILAVFAGVLYTFKTYDDIAGLSRSSKFRKIMTGMGGSALTVWCVFELLFYFQLPERLCLPIAGACGYIGAEVFAGLFLQFIEKKIGNTTTGIEIPEPKPKSSKRKIPGEEN